MITVADYWVADWWPTLVAQRGSSAPRSDPVPGVLEEAAGPAGVRVGPGGL